MSTRLWIAAAAALTFGAAAYADGNVSVEVDPVTRELRITGDAAANEVEIMGAGSPGAYTITGRNGTTVNLQESVDVTEARNVRISTGAGDDRVEITRANIRSKLRVDLADGADALVMSEVRVRGRAGVDAGSGDDRFAATGSVFRGSLAVRGADGADSVVLDRSRLKGRVRLDTGAGNDAVRIDTSDFGGLAEVDVFTGAGDDSVNLDNNEFDDDIDVEAGDNDDHVILADNDFNRSVDVSGGSGDDDLDVRSGNSYRRPPDFDRFNE